MTTTLTRSTTPSSASSPPGRRRSATPAWRRIPKGILIGLLVIVEVYPLFWIFTSSVKSQNEFVNDPLWSLPKHWTFQNYADAWTIGNVGIDLRNSLFVTIPSLVFILVLGSAAAFALEVLVWKGRGTVLLIVVGGIMVPMQIILLPLFTIYFKIGLTNSLWPLIITYVGHGLPLTIFLMVAYFRSVPREMFEAAALDGAGIYRTYLAVGLPMVRNGLFTVALLMFFSTWNDLLIALTFNTQQQLSTIQVGLLNFNGEYGNTLYGPLFAAICMTVFGTLVVYLCINQQVMKGLTAGSVKG
jgi:raffinose/stachyose/melibiose transport system permease protein